MSDWNLDEYDEDDRFHATILRIAELLRSVDEFGVTHIVSSDGNMDDENLDFVEKEIIENLGNYAEITEDEKQLISLLRSISGETREAIWILSDYVIMPK